MKKLIQVLFLILLCILLTGLIILRAQQGPAPEGDVVPGSDIDTADDMSLPDDMMADDMGMTDDMNMTDGIGMDDDMGMMDNMGIPDDMMEEPEPTPTPEPTPELFTISVIGDETLTSHQMLSDQSEYSYAGRMNGDYTYPFKNTVQYFTNDEFTISNLECTLSDSQMYSPQQFYFRAPAANAQILTLGGVDFVTTANNHSLDFGQAGLLSTYAALEEYGLEYGKEDEFKIVTTEHGLRIGVYCAYNDYIPSKDKAGAAIQQMKADGADYIICAFHWGQELYYEPNASQIDIGRACIDAGADLIFGCHTHCLQPIEEYNGGIILYSMGEFSFGGSTSPKDRDTAIFQVTLKRDLDGTITVDGWDVIPCCVSSRPVYEGYTLDNYNDYCPTPYEEGSEDYNRVLSKLDGSYQAASQGADYSNWYSSYG